MRETVPDPMLDAAEIELLDLPPAALTHRMTDGRVASPRAARARRGRVLAQESP